MFGDLRLSKNIVTPSWGFSNFLGVKTSNVLISKIKSFWNRSHPSVQSVLAGKRDLFTRKESDQDGTKSIQVFCGSGQSL